MEISELPQRVAIVYINVVIGRYVTFLLNDFNKLHIKYRLSAVSRNFFIGQTIFSQNLSNFFCCGPHKNRTNSIEEMWLCVNLVQTRVRRKLWQEDAGRQRKNLAFSPNVRSLETLLRVQRASTASRRHRYTRGGS